MPKSYQELKRQWDEMESERERRSRAAPGSLFWQTRGTRKHLMVTTERGSKDTGLYIWKFGEECGISWTAHAKGGRSLGRFLGEVSAQVEAEKFYLANNEEADASR